MENLPEKEDNTDLDGRRLDKVEYCVAKWDLVAVLGDDAHVEVHVRRPQRRVEAACGEQKMVMAKILQTTKMVLAHVHSM